MAKGGRLFSITLGFLFSELGNVQGVIIPVTEGL